MEVMNAIDLLHVTLKNDRCIKNILYCIIQAVQFFTAMAVCISEWREREGDGLNSVVVEAGVFFTNTIVLDFKSN